MKNSIMVNGQEWNKENLAIEPAYSKYANPNPGPDEWAIYYYGQYSKSSVLSGQQSRQYLEAGTRDELETRYPGVAVRGSGYIDPDSVVPSGNPSDYEEPWDENDY